MHTHTLALFSLASLSRATFDFIVEDEKKRKNSLATVMGLRKRHTNLEKKKAKRKRWTHTEIDQFSNREIPFFVSTVVTLSNTLSRVRARERHRTHEYEKRGLLGSCNFERKFTCQNE